MSQRKLLFFESLEDPRHPILGPNLKILCWCGLWPTASKLWNYSYFLFHWASLLFLATEFIEAFYVMNDMNKMLSNLSVTALSLICIMKCLSFVLWQKKWKKLLESISEEEITEIEKGDDDNLKIMADYKQYARIVSYSYWALALLSNLALILAPFMKYLSISYRKDLKNGDETYPEILSSWFPFDKNRKEIYVILCSLQIIMTSKGAAIVAAYDSSAVTIMIFLKGQMDILRNKCVIIFNGSTTNEDVLMRIKECHRHHCFLIRTYKLFNSVLSPIMFAYMLVCSISICFSVIQFVSTEATTFHKLWVIQYTTALIAQLFLYCWHSNEIIIKSQRMDLGVYSSDLWKANVRQRKLILLLAGKLQPAVVLNAGPFTTLSVPTFIDIIKGAYSFFTLFSQIQE